MCDRKNESDDMLQNHGLRVRRAKSWADHAKQCFDQEDVDGAFLFYYIAFNALYSDASMLTGEQSDRQFQVQFFSTLQDLDKEDASLHNFLWNEFSNTIGHILDNPFIYEPYWKKIAESQTEDEISNRKHYEDWKKGLERQGQKAFETLRSSGASYRLFLETFSRLSLLRNQLVHGSATYKGSVNREQVRTGALFLSKAVPLFINTVESHPEIDWGEPPYPPQVTD